MSKATIQRPAAATTLDEPNPVKSPEPVFLPREGNIATADGSVAFTVTGFYTNGSCDVSVTRFNKHGNILSRTNGKVAAVSRADFEAKIAQIPQPKT